MKQLLFAALTLIFFTSNAQTKVQQDKDAIKSMCGCYHVTFEYAETFAPGTAYKFHERHKSGGLEWVFTDEESKDKLVLQHLLVIDDSTIIKHWRQDWLYQNTDIYKYIKDLNWKFLKLPKERVKGQWTQKVFQVDDSPRYQATATWIHEDGKHYWESQADAPLPRREFTTRNDYNVLRRGNRHILTDYGWLHEQDNIKILRSTEGDKIIAMEKGLNKYKKVDDSKCQPAIHWWKTNRAYWIDVRRVWDEIFAEGKELNFEKKIDHTLLWERLFSLEEEVIKNNKANSAESREAIRKIIKQYLISF
jgi:hypothetical protein